MSDDEEDFIIVEEHPKIVKNTDYESVINGILAEENKEESKHVKESDVPECKGDETQEDATKDKGVETTEDKGADLHEDVKQEDTPKGKEAINEDKEFLLPEKSPNPENKEDGDLKDKEDTNPGDRDKEIKETPPSNTIEQPLQDRDIHIVDYVETKNEDSIVENVYSGEYTEEVPSYNLFDYSSHHVGRVVKKYFHYSPHMTPRGRSMHPFIYLKGQILSKDITTPPPRC